MDPWLIMQLYYKGVKHKWSLIVEVDYIVSVSRQHKVDRTASFQLKESSKAKQHQK